MNSKIEGWLSIPKSLYVCLRLLPFRQAIKIPIRVRYNVKLLSLNGRVILPKHMQKFMVLIGFKNVNTHDVVYHRTMLSIDGTIEFKGTATIGSGAQIDVRSGAYMCVGDGMISSCSGHIVCEGNMHIGKGFLMGWDALLMDTDFHPIEDVIAHRRRDIQKDVYIGDNVWMATRSVILKGSKIADGCVVGANSVVAGVFNQKNCIIAGNPARIVRENQSWKLK